MSIETEITRISTNVSDTLSAVSEMGGEVPEGATSNDMAAGVRSIPVGAKIDDTTPSSTTVYSSQKIESVVSALNEANATQDTEIAKKANDAELAKVAKSGSYNDLTNKPTIPTVPSTLPNPNALTFTGAVNETYDGSSAKTVAVPTVPESLKNPNKLTFTGAVTAEYDGSEAVSVEIPAGGSGSYTLPIASATQLGGVMPAAKTGEMTQAVGVDDAGGLWTMVGGGEIWQTIFYTGAIDAGTAYLDIPFEKVYKKIRICTGELTFTDGAKGNLTILCTGKNDSFDFNWSNTYIFDSTDAIGSNVYTEIVPCPEMPAGYKNTMYVATSWGSVVATMKNYRSAIDTVDKNSNNVRTFERILIGSKTTGVTFAGGKILVEGVPV